jgi:hypothetical protein
LPWKRLRARAYYVHSLPLHFFFFFFFGGGLPPEIKRAVEARSDVLSSHAAADPSATRGLRVASRLYARSGFPRRAPPPHHPRPNPQPSSPAARVSMATPPPQRKKKPRVCSYPSRANREGGTPCGPFAFYFYFFKKRASEVMANLRHPTWRMESSPSSPPGSGACVRTSAAGSSPTRAATGTARAHLGLRALRPVQVFRAPHFVLRPEVGPGSRIADLGVGSLPSTGRMRRPRADAQDVWCHRVGHGGERGVRAAELRFINCGGSPICPPGGRSPRPSQGCSVRPELCRWMGPRRGRGEVGASSPLTRAFLSVPGPVSSGQPQA